MLKGKSILMLSLSVGCAHQLPIQGNLLCLISQIIYLCEKPRDMCRWMSIVMIIMEYELHRKSISLIFIMGNDKII